MDGLDIILIGAGFAGLVFSVIAMLRNGAARELLPITVGCLGVVLFGLGGLVEAFWLVIIGGVLLAGGFIFEWRAAKSPPIQSPNQD